MKRLAITSVATVLFIATVILVYEFFTQPHPVHDEHNHEDAHNHEGEHAHEHETESNNQLAQAIKLVDSQQAMANITTQIVEERTYRYELYAPAEVQANGYTSYRVSPRVDSVVLNRHVALGEHVKKGDALVTLFSEKMAQVQASYLVAYEQWKRLQGLGANNASERELFESRTEYQAQKGVLKSFGLDDHVIEQLNKQANVALGEYTLKAAINGVVLSDDFQQGQRVAAGGPLVNLADEASLWVEARLNSSFNSTINSSTPARVQINNREYPAKVQQEAHILDPLTRTRIVRLRIEPNDHSVHPGMFADAYFQFASEQGIVAVNERALMRSPDGHWQVFIKQANNKFVAQEVRLGRRFGDVRQIEGIEPGTEVVVKGAFFVASEQAKSGFDPHNH